MATAKVCQKVEKKLNTPGSMLPEAEATHN
jgi:hypothetical protein